MRKTIVRLGVGALAATALTTSTTFAAPPGPSGTLQLASEATVARTSEGTTGTLTYGESADFVATVDGKVSKQARIYVRVLCRQGGAIVYQYSADPDHSFPLLDQAGQGLDWDGGAADCEASLIYRVEKGRSAELSILDTTEFAVDGTS